jgi:hypothetical protein
LRLQIARPCPVYRRGPALVDASGLRLDDAFKLALTTQVGLELSEHADDAITRSQATLDELNDRLAPVIEEILGHKATTLRGLALQARAMICWYHEAWEPTVPWQGEPEDPSLQAFLAIEWAFDEEAGREPMIKFITTLASALRAMAASSF